MRWNLMAVVDGVLLALAFILALLWVFGRVTDLPVTWGGRTMSIPTGLLILAAVALPLARQRLARAAERRRSDRRRRGACHRCGYDLTANVSGVCPECGAPAPPPPR